MSMAARCFRLSWILTISTIKVLGGKLTLEYP